MKILKKNHSELDVYFTKTRHYGIVFPSKLQYFVKIAIFSGQILKNDLKCVPEIFSI